ncbi:zinc finger protein 704-like [Arapaima gigas]
MNSKRLVDRSLVGIRVSAGAATGQAGNQHAGDGQALGRTATPVDLGIVLACKQGNFLYTLMSDDGTSKEYRGEDVLLNGINVTAGKEKLIFDQKTIVGNGAADHRDPGRTGVQKRSPTHRLNVNGRKLDDQTHSEGRGSGRRAEEHKRDPLAAGADGPPEERYLHATSQIPVPRNRKPSGHADKEVMAATVLTSLSTSPLVLNPQSGPPAAVPEPASRGWKECLSASYSSSTSGNWSWDASDQSVPSTPSPPLSNDVNKSFLLSSQGDDNTEETETTHFPFEDPIPRKRKVPRVGCSIVWGFGCRVELGGGSMPSKSQSGAGCVMDLESVISGRNGTLDQ